MKLDRPKFHNFEPGEFPPPGGMFDVVELKYDGWWGQLELEGFEWRLYSRTGQLKKHGKLREERRYSVLHGEYIFGTEWATEHPEYYDWLAVHGAEYVDGHLVRAASH